MNYKNSSRFAKIATISLIVISIISLVVVGYFVEINATFADTQGDFSERSLDLVNKIRSESSVDPLDWNEQLASAAQAKLNDIVENQYFEHTSPDGKKAWNFILESGYSYVFAGENLAIDYDSVDEAVEAWTKSQSHFENIISNKYEDYGFAQGEGNIEGHKSKIYVQVFATKEGSIKQFMPFAKSN